MSLPLEVSALISGLIAGCVASMITIAIEKFGGLVGGVLGSVPTIIVPASIGWYLNFVDDRQHMPYHIATLRYQRSQLTAVPGMLINVIFLYMWKVLPSLLKNHGPKWINSSTPRLVTGVSVLSLLMWFILAACVVVILTALNNERSLMISQEAVFVFAIVACTLQLSLGIAASWNLPPAPSGKKPISPIQLLYRGLLATTSVFVAIMLSKLSSFLSGVLAIFPAVFFTSMLFLFLQQGAAVQGGAIGPMMLGSISISTYSFCSAFLVPFGGPAMLIVSWLIAVVFASLGSFLFLRWRRIANAKPAEVISVSHQDLVKSASSDSFTEMVSLENIKKSSEIESAGDLGLGRPLDTVKV